MNIRRYLDERFSKKYSDLAKYLSSYSIATAVSLATKSLSSAIIASQGYGNAAIAIGSSVLCTAVFFGTKWPLYRWLHESRYAKGDSVSRDRRIELLTTIISSLVTNAVSICAQYALLKHFRAYPALTGLVSQLAGGGTGAFTKIWLDKISGLVFPSDKNHE